MKIDFQENLNSGLYLKDPQSTEVGKKIIDHSITMIYSLGYEQFTFKKLATEIPTTEATVYRYFENKHLILIYLVDMYWSYMQFQVKYQLNNIVDPIQKIKKIIDLLVWEDNAEEDFLFQSQKPLYYIAIAEGSKTYLSKDVDELNKGAFYKPYKDLCISISDIFLEFKPNYPFPRSLASTLVETSHDQYFFMQHLPKLSDFSKDKNPKDLEKYLEHLVFSSLG